MWMEVRQRRWRQGIRGRLAHHGGVSGPVARNPAQTLVLLSSFSLKIHLPFAAVDADLAGNPCVHIVGSGEAPGWQKQWLQQHSRRVVAFGQTSDSETASRRRLEADWRCRGWSGGSRKLGRDAFGRAGSRFVVCYSAAESLRWLH